jgi:hypothetical protein
VKIPQLRLALEGKIRFHRFLLRRLLSQMQFVEDEIALLEERLEDIGRQRPELAQVRHGMVEKTPKPCRMSSGNSWVYTTFAIELETLR